MLYTDKSIVFLDGKFIRAKEASLNFYSQTLHYGNGAIEGLRAFEVNGVARIFKAEEHFRRLQYSAQRLLIPFTYTIEQLEQITYNLLEQNHVTDAYIRPLIFMEDTMGLYSATQSHLFIGVFKWSKYHGKEELNTCISSYQRPNPKAYPIDAKINGIYVNSILAATEARQRGYDEAILLDSEGFVAQGPGTNIFYEKDGELFTPVKGNIMPGITRQTIIDLAKSRNIPVHENRFGVEALKQADSVFFTGTAAGITTIRSVEEAIFPKKREETIHFRLSKAYEELLRSFDPVTII